MEAEYPRPRRGKVFDVLSRIAALTLVLSACSSSAPSPQAKAEPAPAELANTAPGKTNDRDAVARLVGTRPSQWRLERWLNSQPLELGGLRGNVLLVRWWTTGCPYCSDSAPALRGFHDTYGTKGLRVVGVYHHKEDTPFAPAVYEATTKKYDFAFPVAFDPDWRTFHDWMRDAEGTKVDTGWTSVTFILDKRGVIRHVHPGGSYAEGEPGYVEITSVIENLLAEPA